MPHSEQLDAGQPSPTEVPMRRIGLAVLITVLVLAPLAGGAQQPARLPTIGFPGASTPAAMRDMVAAFVGRLHELGWVEGRNIAIVEALSVSPVAVSSTLALFVLLLVVVFASSPLPLVGPLAPILLMPAWRLAGFPLAPVTRRGMVVPSWYEQDRARNELGSDDDPRAVVSRTHIPAAVRKGPILPVVEEEIGGICRHGRRGRHVLDLRRLGDDDQRWRSGKLNADVHVHLSVDWGSQGDSQ